MKLPVLAATIAAISLAACATAGEPPETSALGGYLSGRLAAGMNDIDAAADNFAAASAENPADADLARNAFLFNLAAGRVEAAASFARLGDEEDEGEGLERFTLAAVKLKKGDLIGARDDLKAELNEPFIRSVAFLTEAWIEADLAGPAAGIAAFDIGKDVFTGFNPTFKAMLLEEKGDIDAARANHQISVASFGGPVGREAYGAFLERRGNAEETRSYYELLAKEGGPSRRLAGAGLDRLARNAPSKAFLDVSAQHGAALGLYLFAGNALQQSAEEMQRATEAGFKISERPFNLPLALAELAVYLDPDLSDAHRLIGSINNIYGNYAAARASFARVGASSPQFEQAQIEIANSLAAEGRGGEAIKTLKNALRRDKNADDVRLALAGYYADEGRHEEAVATISAAIEARGDHQPPEAWRDYITRASSYIELDRFEDAEADLKKAVEIAPEEPVALNFLGYSWVERGINLDEAFAMIEKAVALRPQSGAIIDSLGWAHYQRGDYEEALPHLEKAAALVPGDSTVTDHLGDVYWRLGRKIEARFQWERSLELDPPARVRALIEEKLKSGLAPTLPSPEKK